MRLSDFDYHLPKELIAQEPANPRDSSRLMVVDGKKIEHKHFRDVISYLRRGDILVLNDTKVEPVKLLGRKTTGSPAEFLVTKKLGPRVYECMIKTNKIRPGTEFVFSDNVRAKVVGGSDGVFEVAFNTDNLDAELQKIGEMPLPPYIKKKATREQYQTVFAKKSGSIAAPTAGFHFTPELLLAIEKIGVKIVKVTLHVSYGTFLPVKTDDIEKHKMHSEWYEITDEAADAINNRVGRLVVVGTTALRTLESAADDMGIVHAAKKDTSIFIYPGYSWKLKPDIMITNFHLPKSTLIMLISALIGLENVMDAYAIAVKEKYRFYSFGDAMMIILS